MIRRKKEGRVSHRHIVAAGENESEKLVQSLCGLVVRRIFSRSHHRSAYIRLFLSIYLDSIEDIIPVGRCTRYHAVCVYLLFLVFHCSQRGAKIEHTVLTNFVLD